MTANSAVVVLESPDAPQRCPRAIGRQPLNTIQQVREEMGRVYRAVAQGKISVKQGAQMTYMLQVQAKTIEVEKIEPALEIMMREREERRRLGG
jgi:hypothetical protein